MVEIPLPRGFTLMRNEKPLWYGRYSWKAAWLAILIGILTIWFLFLGVFILLYVAVVVYSTEYLVTNKRIYVSKGAIARRVIEIKNEWLIRTSMTQDVAGRLLNYGTVVVTTPEQYYGQFTIVGVSDPQQLMQIIESIREGKPMPKFQIYSGPGR